MKVHVCRARKFCRCRWLPRGRLQIAIRHGPEKHMKCIRTCLAPYLVKRARLPDTTTLAGGPSRDAHRYQGSDQKRWVSREYEIAPCPGGQAPHVAVVSVRAGFVIGLKHFPCRAQFYNIHMNHLRNATCGQHDGRG